MTTKVAPWLEGLSEAWEAPQKPTTTTTNIISSATHNAGAVQNNKSKIPRPSLGPRQNTAAQTSTQKKRNPLAPLSSNDGNTLRRQNGTTRLTGTRSVSEASDGSVLVNGTVQQRSKSASPSKKQETLEWKKRLVRGEVGYGDQTDLFGPSGLENIFSPSKGAENETPKNKNRMAWLKKADAPMPSSPPPWPSSVDDHSEDIQNDGSQSVAEEDLVSEANRAAYEAYGSSRSNPFDLESSAASHIRFHGSTQAGSSNRSSPDKAFIDPTQNELAGNRTISGQTELEQEDFSPVYVSKHKTVSGQVNYAALDSHLVKQFQNMEVDLRHPSQEQSQESNPGSTGQPDFEEEPSKFTDEPRSDSIPERPDLSFSENLPTGSPFPNLGKNVQFERGGFSQNGSFKQRPLSPSQLTIGESTDQNASDLLSPLPPLGQRPPAPTPPKGPSTPVQAEEPKSRSSGSPLKLFGAHDTFTNNRLLRRLSQLNPDGTLRQLATEVPSNIEPKSRTVSNGSAFGNGELDSHTFDAEITITSASDPSSDRSPGSEVPVPGSKTPLGFRFEASSTVENTFKMKRKLSKHSGAASKTSTMEIQKRPEAELQATVEDASESHLEAVPSPEPDRRYGEGKRPPTSPFKNPTPKRRRTLHASELEEVANANLSYHSQMYEAFSSRKRKDARRGEAQNQADADTLAQRKILRPRNPTPNQRRRQQIEAELREAAEEFAEQEPERLEAVMEQIETSMASETGPTLEQQAQTLASEVAAFTLRVHKPSGDQGERKRSVTTQDFLDEAMMVMNLIRAKARPQSNLGSVEESEAEGSSQNQQGDVSQQDESQLQVSRPPSREGSGWRRRGPMQTDARVISHLRRFEETEEVDDTNFIANSIASLQVDDEEHMNDQVVVVDENSNIRITGPSAKDDRERPESDSRPVSQRSQGSTLDTQNSGGTSTGRTIGTSSTRKSENVGTLAPDAVAHLIGNQVGGMTFDREQQRWVRFPKSPERKHGSFLELPSNVTSDDDPFREISDLPVDEQKEIRRLSSASKRARSQNVDAEASPSKDQSGKTNVGSNVEVITISQEAVAPRPVTRDSSHVQHNHSSSVPSRYTVLASSQQEKVETRATSWSDEELAKMSAYGRARQQPLMYAAAQAAMAQRALTSEPVQQNRKLAAPPLPRRPTPDDVATENHVMVAEEVQDDGASDGLCDDTSLEAEVSSIEDIDSPKLRQTPSKPAFPPSSIYRTATRQMSLRKKTFTNLFNSDAVEQSEVSIVAPLPGDRMMSLSLSVSRPISTRQHQRQVTEVQSSPSKGSSSLILSDLPDFTIHELDEERPSERSLATRLAKHAAAEVNDRYALAVKELVKILTDVKEDEPYWEDLKQLDLHERSLSSLYGLGDFCTRIQDMDVSKNALQHLHGAPSTIRKLNASFNQLSSLTAWNHLLHLQYLDVSNNHLENLKGLIGLVHLREIRADDNFITNLDGVVDMDGLLQLRLRRNKLEKVDLENSQLYRLTELDLCGNKISTIKYLECLRSLSHLRLDENDLKDGVQAEHEMSHLISISLRNCNLEHLNVSWCSRLEHLNVDDNRLASIENIGDLKGLKTLSMRRQALPEDKAISIFGQCLEANTVNLSGNSIPALHLSKHFLNVRHLELASAGLKELPVDFSQRMPNLRTLNLNFNSLKDLSPLANIRQLEKLTICGNRLNRLRKSVATLQRLPSLRTLDMRENPLTQGFYPSLASTMSKHTSIVPALRDLGPKKEDERDDEIEKSRYDFPAGDAVEDKKHSSRLDEDTELRRRVYEVLLANSCRPLSELDGISFDRAKALQRDKIWERLVELNILRKTHDRVAELLE